MFKKIITAVSFVAASFLSAGVLAEDAVVADPDHYVVEFENERVRIIRINYGPGEKSVMHTHGPNVSIIITEGDMRMSLPDGTSREVSFKPGDVSWNENEEHLPENLGSGPVEVILVEVKE